MVRWLIILISFLGVEKLPAQISVNKIITGSKKYYQKNISGLIQIESRFKSSIAEAISADTFKMSYDRKKSELILFAGTGEIMFLKEKHLFEIDTRNNTFSDLSVHKSAMQDFITQKKEYPFYFFSVFSRLKNSGFKSRLYNGFFQLYNNTEQYNFDTLDYSMKSFRSVTLSQYGVQIKEWKVLEEMYPGEKHIEFADTANACLKRFAESTYFPVLPESNLINQPLVSLFHKTLLSTVNAGEIDILHRKDAYLLIDMFYQSCMPCVASFPDLKNLVKKYDQTGKLMIIGLDPVVNDSTTMLKFIKRYGLNYPIAVGMHIKEAIYKLNPGGVYPKYILVNAEGIIIAVQEGFNESFFNEIGLLIGKGE